MKINKTMVLAISLFAGVFGSVILAFSTTNLDKAWNENRALQRAEIKEIKDDLTELNNNSGGVSCTTRSEKLHYDIKHSQAVQLGVANCSGTYGTMVGGGCAPDRDEDTYTEVDYNIPYGANGWFCQYEIDGQAVDPNSSHCLYPGTSNYKGCLMKKSVVYVRCCK